MDGGESATAATTIANNHSENQQQPGKPPVAFPAEVAATGRPPSGQNQQQHKPKSITHRSQSSPSSLTTHKFGLKPTPSPPRLIIDHNTGDIVESYPEQPIYLKTYQPLDEEELLLENQQTSSLTDNTFDDSLAHPYPPPLQTSTQLDDYNRILLEHYQKQQQLEASSGDESLSQPAAMSNRNYRPAIPPPHSGKVYFAPPAISGHHQLYQPQENSSFFAGSGSGNLNQEEEEEPQAVQQRHFAPANSSFKRALNKISENSKTDIAIVTDEGSANSSPNYASPRQVKITATSANKATALLQKQVHHKQASQPLNGNSKTRQFKREMPSIEDFNLYNFCYLLRLLLVCAISIYVIYLLVGPLHLDCNFYRPTFTYLSIIVSSVNLICIVIFSLFWYCNGVTRTLYSNLSSSAFIITIYSILVAINLALGILFFLINTCHFQKLINTRSSLVHLNVGIQPAAHSGHRELPGAASLMASLIPSDELDFVDRLERRHSEFEKSMQKLTEEELILESGRIKKKRRDCRDGIGGEDCNGEGLPASLQANYNQDELPAELFENQDEQQSETTLTESPLEAAWEWFKEQLRLFKKNFKQFVIDYDFRFIGTLHALCAICLQYMAMKVAFVRSHFCSPVGPSYV